MNTILNHWIGFRKRNKVYMTIASIYYILTLLLAIKTGDFIFGIVFFWSAPFCLFAIVEAISKRKPSKLLILVFCFVLLVASSSTLYSELESISLNINDINFTEIGQSQEIGYTVYPADAATANISIVSNNSNIAKIEDGKLIAVSEGTTQVYAENKSKEIKSTPIKVTVVDESLQQRHNLANEIIEKIDSINSNNLLLENEKIQEARKAYVAADEQTKVLVTNIDKLTTYETEYSTLKEQEDKKEVEAVAAAAASSAAAQQNKGQNTSYGDTTVYISESGSKYHRESCRTLKGKGSAISLEQAKQMGFEACKVCH